MMTFELETLSQHRDLIERLQDEVFTQRIQIEEQCNQMEKLQGRLEQMEKKNRKSTTPNNN